jgi:hypothetical protein
MASVDFPVGLSLGGVSDQTAALDLNDQKRKSHCNEMNSSNNVPEGPPSITYHYLTFETTLPLRSKITSSKPVGGSRPPMRDLKKYTSPFEWSKSRKNFTICLSCFAAIITAFAAGSYATAAHQCLSSGM